MTYAWIAILFSLLQTTKTDVWSRLGLAGESISAITLATPGSVYAGTPSGAVIRIENRTQTRLVPDLGGGSNAVTAIAVDPRNASIVYASTAEGVFKSIDAGNSWVRVSTEITECLAIAIDTQDSNILYAAAGTLGLFKSANSGVTWSRSLLPPVENVLIDPQSPAVVYAATNLGVLKSTDRGESWSSQPWTHGPIRGLAIDPWTPSTLYAGKMNGGVLKSLDGGLTWSESGLPSIPIFALVVDIQESSTVYAASEAGVFKSVDGGKIWLPINNGLSAGTVAMIGDLALCRIYIGTKDGVFETDIGPVLTIHSNLCIGSEWSVVVSHGGGNAPIRLLGISNGISWEVSNWGTTDGSGMFKATGAFPAYTEGTHQLRVEVGGILSNIISFTVTNCR